MDSSKCSRYRWRRINGVKDTQKVYDTILMQIILVMGLGDVYLGAPVATPLDPTS